MDWLSCSDPVNHIPTLACVPILFQNVVSIALSAVGIVALFLIMWGGVKFILSRGDAKQAQSARQIITYAIIGLIIVVSSFFIVNFIANVTGTTCIKEFGIKNCEK